MSKARLGLRTLRGRVRRHFSMEVTSLVPMLMTALILAGLGLRVRGYLTSPISLWEDEAAWAVRLLEGQPLWNSIRPPGFIATSKLFVSLFGASEFGLRALPWLAGLATLLLAPPLANRLWSSPAARLLFVAVIALHPGAIDLAKEFKPYSVSLAFHMAMLLLALRYAQGRQTLALVALLGTAFVSNLFAQDCVFAYPAAFGVALLEALRARNKSHVAVIVGAGALTVGLLAAQFFLVWRSDLKGRSADTSAADYWGQKYDVFYEGPRQSEQTRLRWVAGKLSETAAMPGMRRERWEKPAATGPDLDVLQAVDARLWLVLASLGLVVLAARRRHRELALLGLPVVAWLTCNWLGAWPFGVFRTNLFALLYSSACAASAFDLTGGKRPVWDLAPAGVLVILPFLLFTRDFGTHKSSSMTRNSSFRAAMHALVTLQANDPPGQHPPLFLDRGACAAWRYYTRYRVGSPTTLRGVSNLEPRCSKALPDLLAGVRKALRRPGARAYVLASQTMQINELSTNLPPDLAADGEVLVGPREQLVLRLKRRRAHR